MSLHVPTCRRAFHMSICLCDRCTTVFGDPSDYVTCSVGKFIQIIDLIKSVQVLPVNLLKVLS